MEPDNNDMNVDAEEAGPSQAAQASQNVDRERVALIGTGRMTQACDRCRWKKVKCDGLVPSCSRCTAAGLQCLVTAKLSRKSYPKSYTEAIEERIRQLEAELTKSKGTIETQTSQILRLRSSLAQKNAVFAEDSSGADAQKRFSQQSSDGGRSKQPQYSAKEPVVREVGRINLDRTGTGRFMGSSSGIFFIGTAQQRFGAERRLAGIETERVVGDELLRVESDDRTVPLDIQSADEEGTLTAMLSELPEFGEARRLVEFYYEFWGGVFPVFHRPSFFENIDLLYAEKRRLNSKGQTQTQKRTSTGASEAEELPKLVMASHLCIVIALAARHEQLISQPSTPAKGIPHFATAMRCYDFLLSRNDLTSLQFQCLLTQWYVAIGKISLAMQMTGSLCKLALELGMHRHSRRFTYNPLVTEERKRLFWIIYILDHSFSAIAGLPKSLRDEDIDVEMPSDLDDDLITTKNYLLGLPGEPTVMSRFIAFAEIAKILSSVLAILYTTTNRRGAVSKIAQSHRQIQQWHQQLPPHLHLPYDTDPMLASFARLKSHGASMSISGEDANLTIDGADMDVVFIHLVYWYTRFVTHRPAVSFPPTHPQYILSIQDCATSAKAIIALCFKARSRMMAWDINPGANAYTLWSAGVMILFQIWETRKSQTVVGSTSTPGGSPSQTDDGSAAVTGSATMPLKEMEEEGFRAVNMCLETLRDMSALGKVGVQERHDDLQEMLKFTFDSSRQAFETTPMALPQPQQQHTPRQHTPRQQSPLRQQQQQQQIQLHQHQQQQQPQQVILQSPNIPIHLNAQPSPVMTPQHLPSPAIVPSSSTSRRASAPATQINYGSPNIFYSSPMQSLTEAMASTPRVTHAVMTTATALAMQTPTSAAFLNELSLDDGALASIYDTSFGFGGGPLHHQDPSGSMAPPASTPGKEYMDPIWNLWDDPVFALMGISKEGEGGMSHPYQTGAGQVDEREHAGEWLRDASGAVIDAQGRRKRTRSNVDM